MIGEKGFILITYQKKKKKVYDRVRYIDTGPKLDTEAAGERGDTKLKVNTVTITNLVLSLFFSSCRTLQDGLWKRWNWSRYKDSCCHASAGCWCKLGKNAKE